VLGWINGVAGRVINPPLPFDLGGGTFPPPTLLQLAAMAACPREGGAQVPMRRSAERRW